MSREGRRRWGLNQWFVIGKQDNPMMERWRLIQTPWFGLYVHFIYREDLDPIPHDHPWNFWRMVLCGGYTERYWDDPANGRDTLRSQRRWRPSRVPVEHAHRIVGVQPCTVSLVLVGRKRRAWGFWDSTGTPSSYADRIAAAMGASIDIRPRAVWVDYRDALGLRPTEGVVGDGVHLCYLTRQDRLVGGDLMFSCDEHGLYQVFSPEVVPIETPYHYVGEQK